MKTLRAGRPQSLTHTSCHPGKRMASCCTAKSAIFPNRRCQDHRGHLCHSGDNALIVTSLKCDLCSKASRLFTYSWNNTLCLLMSLTAREAVTDSYATCLLSHSNNLTPTLYENEFKYPSKNSVLTVLSANDWKTSQILTMSKFVPFSSSSSPFK